MSYPLILGTLHEFGLITDEQLAEAWCEYQEGNADYNERMEAFQEQWLAERAAKPWWRRWFIWKSGWINEWYALPPEVRYPPDEREQRLYELMEQACG